MHYLFVVIFVLVAALVLLNIQQVMPRFVEDESRPKVLVYLGTLFCLGFLVIHLAYRVIEFVQMAQDLQQEDVQIRTPFRFAPRHFKAEATPPSVEGG